jgi:hypothetical protein
MTVRVAGFLTTMAPSRAGVVRDATLAASEHNSQPWRFVVTGSRVEVWLDPRSRPTVIDSDGRWTLESLGAAARVRRSGSPTPPCRRCSGSEGPAPTARACERRVVRCGT